MTFLKDKEINILLLFECEPTYTGLIRKWYIEWLLTIDVDLVLISCSSYGAVSVYCWPNKPHKIVINNGGNLIITNSHLNKEKSIN